jgi:subtilisin-like proprotein convertase family protein
VHPRPGDLAVELVAPDGRSYRVKFPSRFDDAADVDVVATVNAAGSPLAGMWSLEIRDVFAGDTGFLDRWGLLVPAQARHGQQPVRRSLLRWVE